MCGEIKTTMPKKIKKHFSRSNVSILNAIYQNRSSIPILQNGSRMFSSEDPKRQVILYQTCRFDSAFQIYAAIYVDCIEFRALINESNDDFSSFIKFVINNHDIQKCIRKRAELLINFYSKYCEEIDENIQDISKKIRQDFFTVNKKSSIISKTH